MTVKTTNFSLCLNYAKEKWPQDNITWLNCSFHKRNNLHNYEKAQNSLMIYWKSYKRLGRRNNGIKKNQKLNWIVGSGLGRRRIWLRAASTGRKNPTELGCLNYLPWKQSLCWLLHVTALLLMLLERGFTCWQRCKARPAACVVWPIPLGQDAFQLFFPWLAATKISTIRVCRSVLSGDIYSVDELRCYYLEGWYFG